MKKDYDDTGATATMNRPQGVRDDDQSGKAAADKEEMMRKAQAAGEPGPVHKALEHFVGDWRAEVKCWQEPGGAAHVSQGTAKGTWTLGGRFLQEDFQGEMMGRPFRGRSLLGYDNFKQTFNSVWVSDMQTSMFVTEGKGEIGGKVITLEGKSSCAETGRKDIPMRVVMRVLGPDKHTFEMFDDSAGQNGKMMEITYIRA